MSMNQTETPSAGSRAPKPQPGSHGLIDIAIRYGSGGWSEVEAEPLCTAKVFPVCAPQVIAGNPPEKPDDLARYTLLHENSRQWWADWLRAAGGSDGDDPGAFDGGAGGVVGDGACHATGVDV